MFTSKNPLRMSFAKDECILDAAKRHGRVVQHGTQMRSSEVTQRAGEVLRSGLLGDVKMAKTWNVQRRQPPKPGSDSEPPRGVHYDIWLGPAPERPFNANRFHGNWHLCQDYGNGDIGNDGALDLDMVRWGLGATTHPVKITVHGSRVDLGGVREFPDNMMVAYEYADRKVLLYEDRIWTPYRMDGFDSGNAFYGTKGYMIFSRRGYFQAYLGDNDEKGLSMNGDAGMARHVDDFLDYVRQHQEPNGSAGVAHLSRGPVHLGEISHRLDRVLRFDPGKESFIGDDQANQMLTKSYRSPWGLPARIRAKVTSESWIGWRNLAIRGRRLCQRIGAYGPLGQSFGEPERQSGRCRSPGQGDFRNQEFPGCHGKFET